MTTQEKNKTAILFILLGLITCVVLSLFLPAEKLMIAMPGPTALIGAGLAQWSSDK